MTYQERKTIMMGYLQLKVDERDWHGVADAAMDLRELDVAIHGLDRHDTQQPLYPTNTTELLQEDYLRNR